MDIFFTGLTVRGIASAIHGMRICWRHKSKPPMSTAKLLAIGALFLLIFLLISGMSGTLD